MPPSYVGGGSEQLDLGVDARELYQRPVAKRNAGHALHSEDGQGVLPKEDSNC